MAYDHHLRQGLRDLAKHRPHEAIRSFTKVINSCPVENQVVLSKTFYYLGFALQRLGLSGSALKSWRAGEKLKVDSRFSKILHRYLNCYGMVRQSDPVLDDWKAFYSIQLEKYLVKKSTKRIGTLAEGDMIQQLLWEKFIEIRDTDLLTSLSACEKKKFFREIKVFFPYVDVSQDRDVAETIRYQFGENSAKSRHNCDCGADLPTSLCCRLTPGDDELQSGVF